MAQWIFNPPEPACWPTKAGFQRDGLGAADVPAIAGHWRIDVQFVEDEWEFYPEAGGEHVLSRRLRLFRTRHPFHNPDLFPEGLDFDVHRQGLAYWDAPSTTEDEITVKWRMAYGWPWSRWGILGGTADGLDRAWTVWYGPAFWIAPLADEFPTFDEWRQQNNLPQPTSLPELLAQQDLWVSSGGLNIAIPLYTSDAVSGERNRFDGLRPVTLTKRAVGNNVVPGIFDFPEFPEILTITPWWP